MDLNRIMALLDDRMSCLCLVRDDDERQDTYQALLRRLDARSPLDVRFHQPRAIETTHGAIVSILTVAEAIAERGGLAECHIPAGSFFMGRTDGDLAETPMLRHTVAAFWMTTYPITVQLYDLAVQTNALPAPEDATGPTWEEQRRSPTAPVVLVSQADAEDFAAWLRSMTGTPWRLPTEVEWEYAGRGTDQRLYPWGDASTPWRAHVADQHDDDAPAQERPEPVGQRPDNVSPFGVADLVGNCDEWTSTAYAPYGVDPPAFSAIMVVRGGSYEIALATLCYRNAAFRHDPSPTLGFRLVRSW